MFYPRKGVVYSMKKIGIVTIFRDSDNFGAALQAYALQKVVTDMGYQADVIDIIFPRQENHPPVMKDIYRVVRKLVPSETKIGCYLRYLKANGIKTFYPESREYIAEEYAFELRRLRFRKFRKEQIRTFGPVQEKNILSAGSNYDIYIAGSDQIWNPSYWRKPYFLNFVQRGKIKASYAASIGRSVLSDEEKAIFERNLRDFDLISVREQEGKKLLEQLTDKPVEVVLDPTLLLDAAKWDKIAEPSNVEGKYLLCCCLGESREYREYTRKIADRFRLSLIFLETTKRCVDIGRGISDKTLIDVSPGMFLTLVRNAELVITDSFHVAVFSIIYRKIFYLLRRDEDADSTSMNSRIYTLLKELSLEDQLIEVDDENVVDNGKDIYKDINLKLEPLRISSLAFLKKILGKSK